MIDKAGVGRGAGSTLTEPQGAVVGGQSGLRGAVIIPAHDEEAVIARTLRPLAPLAEAGVLSIVVACNGCSDRTAAVASGFAGVEVIEVEAASKVAALNVADAILDQRELWPRFYLDADVELGSDAVLSVLDHLSRVESPSAARPARRYLVDGATPLVRCYYRARSRIPALDQHLWGAGAYAVNQAGHDRFGSFASVTADDLWIDRQFDRSEITIVRGVTVGVRPPRTVRALLHNLTRVYGGNRDVDRLEPSRKSQPDSDSWAGPASGRTIGPRAVLATISSPTGALDAVVYIGVVLIGRMLSRRAALGWARDESSRSPVDDSQLISPAS